MIQPITNGAISGTGTVDCPNGYLGAIVITTDGTNAGTVVLRKDSSTGTVLYDYSGMEAGLHEFKKGLKVGSARVYYSITGTGCQAQIHEYVP